ncbi:MAG TPA: hypothetical protein VKA95_11730 [Nitrososphaeraceae archaeon]|nr:hypothetical protein [Nitrososphaeraceae archaeon]
MEGVVDGPCSADELRDLAKTLRKIRLSLAECTLGVRVTMIMKKAWGKRRYIHSYIIIVCSRIADYLLNVFLAIMSYFRNLERFSYIMAFS